MMKKQNWADAVEAIYHQKELLDTAMCSYGENVYDQIIKRFAELKQKHDTGDSK